MSTLSISPAFVAGTARTPRLTRNATVRLTQRGRIVFLFAFLAIALVVMVSLGGLATATLDSGTPEPVRVIEVQPGDTLYGIAGDLAEPGKVREMVHRIQQLNSLPGGGLVAGQKLAIPQG
ncbi:LysM peptidoglycan-binding domain-containing protein [Nocardioides marmoriginsengisoli]|uniref:LysM peptidoglycan-binding domain-containing protein n=1 Tax=Nocardioides marmoriginsengisoli TaxID=661483 RepID=A0A3N0CPL5_9ACTN|nr:LysM peptidoglycan-binding domain-containing protein [Nocardioides marmoriginsengisoli]RNL65412.1 LysM peptidoglycan-binding domain-containing protein [Nocardioides marmoriginsengisoli]